MMVFDMDGVLVDVTESYRETMVRTVEHFTGKAISRDSIQEYKNQGGWNNDWLLSQKICHDLGVEVPYRDRRRIFQLSVSRSRHDSSRALAAARRIAGSLGRELRISPFSPGAPRKRRKSRSSAKVCATASCWSRPTTSPCEKPAPDGLLKIAAMHPGKKLLYIGDTVDDARCAKAAYVPFIGIAARHSPRRDELVELLQLEGAIQVIEDINEIG